MNNERKIQENTDRFSFLEWLIGGLIFAAGLLEITDSYKIAIPVIIVSFFIFPPFVLLVERTLLIRLSGLVRLSLFFLTILFIDFPEVNKSLNTSIEKNQSRSKINSASKNQYNNIQETVQSKEIVNDSLASNKPIEINNKNNGLINTDEELMVDVKPIPEVVAVASNEINKSQNISISDDHKSTGLIGEVTIMTAKVICKAVAFSDYNFDAWSHFQSTKLWWSCGSDLQYNYVDNSINEITFFAESFFADESSISEQVKKLDIQASIFDTRHAKKVKLEFVNKIKKFFKNLNLEVPTGLLKSIDSETSFSSIESYGKVTFKRENDYNIGYGLLVKIEAL